MKMKKYINRTIFKLLLTSVITAAVFFTAAVPFLKSRAYSFEQFAGIFSFENKLEAFVDIFTGPAGSSPVKSSSSSEKCVWDNFRMLCPVIGTGVGKAVFSFIAFVAGLALIARSSFVKHRLKMRGPPVLSSPGLERFRFIDPVRKWIANRSGEYDIESINMIERVLKPALIKKSMRGFFLCQKAGG